MQYHCYGADFELDLMEKFRMHHLQLDLDQIFPHPIATIENIAEIVEL